MRYLALILLFFLSFSLANESFKTQLITTKNQATLTYQTVEKSQKAILYIHGFNDYFFNEAFAEQFLDHGYSFYAIDLHNYGRNLNANSQPFYFENINEFDDEITSAIDFIKKQGATNITLYGYSQGGLIASLYTNKFKNVNQLILDSAFFDFAFSSFLETYILPVVSFIGEYFPTFKIDSSSPNIFGQTLHKDFNGEWDFDLKKKYTITNAPIYLGWIHAIYKAQQQLQQGLDLQIPVLSLYSDKSHTEKENVAFHHISDLVLDVKDIQNYSKKLNKDEQLTTLAVIPNGMHGVTFSKIEVRTKAYETIFKWLDAQN